MLKKLIGIYSPSGRETELQKFIYSYGKKLNIETFKQEKNIVFFIKGVRQKKAIIFNGHVDTVSPGEIIHWTYPPYGKNLQVSGDKIYGIGASDMKAGVFAFLEVANYYSKKKPPVDLWFSFVVNEEVDGSGSKNFVKWFKSHHLKSYDVISALIAEPSGLKKIELGHKGNYFISITTYGDSGHGAYPERVRKHAVLEMMKIHNKLLELEKHWSKKYRDKILGVPTIAHMTSISAGDPITPNKFPSSCTATFDIRTTPKVHSIVIDELKSAFKNIQCDIKILHDPASYSYTSPDTKIVSLIKSTVKNAKTGTANGASDQCFFTEVGIPTVIFGPGEKEVIHKPNEYCLMSKISKSIKIYRDIVEHY